MHVVAYVIRHYIYGQLMVLKRYRGHTERNGFMETI